MSNKPDAIVFFDLDGTLFNRQVEVAPSTLEALAQLKKNNIKSIIATGRTVCEVQHIMHQTGIDSIIAMNGQSVFYQGEHVFANNIDNDVIDRVLSYSKNETGIPLSFYNHQTMRISEHSSPAIKFYQHLRQNVPPVDSEIYYKETIQMLLLLCEHGEDIYRDEFPELTFIRNTPYCVDVFNAGGSKAYGINQLITNKNFHHIPTYAFGDGLNDLEMFGVVDYPIAMKNGVAELKAIAKHITDDNDNDGIANGLKHMGLI